MKTRHLLERACFGPKPDGDADRKSYAAALREAMGGLVPWLGAQCLLSQANGCNDAARYPFDRLEEHRIDAALKPVLASGTPNGPLGPIAVVRDRPQDRIRLLRQRSSTRSSDSKEVSVVSFAPIARRNNLTLEPALPLS